MSQYTNFDSKLPTYREMDLNGTSSIASFLNSITNSTATTNRPAATHGHRAQRQAHNPRAPQNATQQPIHPPPHQCCEHCHELRQQVSEQAQKDQEIRNEIKTIFSRLEVQELRLETESTRRDELDLSLQSVMFRNNLDGHDYTYEK